MCQRVLWFALAAAGAASMARAASESNMATLPGSSATITVSLTVSTALGTSSDSDVKTVTTTGTTHAIFTPTPPPFSAVEIDALQIMAGNTTFNFQLFCLPFIGCQNLNVTITDLTFTAVEPFFAPLAPNGAVAFSDVMIQFAGSYSTSGLASDSGTFDQVSGSNFSGRITNTLSTVLLDQLSLAAQTVMVPPEDLPAGVNALTLTVTPNLTNTKLQGPFTLLVPDFDADNDGDVDLADHTALAGCVTGPGGGLATPGCAVFDADSDSDVDALDVAEFLVTFGAP